MKYTISYAQNFEDLILDAFFPDVEHGHYVDVGAFHPIVDSVTRYFYLKGWRGMNIEPQKGMFDALMLDRPDDTNLNLGAGARPDTLMFNQYSLPGLSTFSSSIEKSYASASHRDTGEAQRYEIEVNTLANLLTAHPLPHIHFMKIDVEGFEYEVLEGNDWSRFQPDVLCIESDHIVKDWHKLLADQGYELVHSDCLNEYFVSRAARSRAKHFRQNYIDRTVKKEPIKYRQYEQILAGERKVQSLRSQVDMATRENEHLNNQLNHFRHQIAVPRGIRRQILELVRSIDRSILWRLDLWQYHTQQRHARGIVPRDVPKLRRPDEQLAAIQAADLATYWDGSRTPVAPKVVWHAYKAVWKLLGFGSELYRSAKVVLRGVRRKFA